MILRSPAGRSSLRGIPSLMATFTDCKMTDDVWWKRGIVYQIYPRSFQDTNGDGVGDLNGIRQRLGYLHWLGVDAIWISPVYPSPMADFGYDVSDYCGIDPLFGTLADFDLLIAEAHAMSLKLILDFVPNHTSDCHPWFVESRASRTNARRDWYIWRDGKPDGGPPNNWMSQFGGSAWTFDPATGQYYLHSFLKEQPDLNWRNPDVKTAMFDALRFWLDRGVDGFRVDVIWLLIKDAALRDNPPNPDYRPTDPDIKRFLSIYNGDQDDIHALIAEMRSLVDHYGERVLIGEIYLPLEKLVTYYGRDLSGAHLPFNFQLIHTAWNAKSVAMLVQDYEKALPQRAWPNWVLGNHDQARIAARVGPDQARIAAMLLLTLRGTPTMYYGDELGIGRVDIPQEVMRDPWEKNEPGLGLSRDPSRTPFQWDASENAGFTSGRPWLPLAPDAGEQNVATLKGDTHSILGLYKGLIEMRRAHAALNIGEFRSVVTNDNVLLYERRAGTQRLLIALNFGNSACQIDLPDVLKNARVLMSTHCDREEALTRLSLRPNEGVILAPA